MSQYYTWLWKELTVSEMHIMLHKTNWHTQVTSWNSIVLNPNWNLIEIEIEIETEIFIDIIEIEIETEIEIAWMKFKLKIWLILADLGCFGLIWADLG